MPTADGGCYIGATAYCNDGDASGNHGERDMWVVKLSGTGSLTWQRMLGGSQMDELMALEGTPDGGLIIAGTTASNDGDVVGFHAGWDLWVVKLDDAGAIQWQKTMGGSSLEDARDVRTTLDGGYVVLGRRVSNDGDLANAGPDGAAWVVKLDASGVMQWQNAIGNYSENWPTVLPTADGGYMVTCTVYSLDGGDISGYHGSDPTNGDYWTVKLDAAGDIEWQRCSGGDDVDEARTFQLTGDGGCVAYGRAGSINGDVTGNHGGTDGWLVRLDPSGTLQWQLALGGSGQEVAGPMHVTSDGGYIVTATVESGNGSVAGSGFHGVRDAWVVKLASDGTGIEEPIDPGFTIAPVPATNTVRITARANMQNAIVSLTDPLGREVLGTRMSGTGHVLDVTGLARGAYHLTLIMPTGRSTQRLLLE